MKETLTKIAFKNQYLNPGRILSEEKMRKKYQDIAESYLLADPIREFHMPILSDGAACLLVAKPETARQYCNEGLDVLGIGEVSDTRYAHYGNGSHIPMIDESVNIALEKTGLCLDDIKVVDVYDSGSILEILMLDVFAGSGKGVHTAYDAIQTDCKGKVYYDTPHGKKLFNPDGGLKGGHPFTPSGIRQFKSLFDALKPGEIGMATSIEGIGSQVNTLIVRRY